MTIYEQGFMNHCLKRGVPGQLAVAMLKRAEAGCSLSDKAGRNAYLLTHPKARQTLKRTGTVEAASRAVNRWINNPKRREHLKSLAEKKGESEPSSEPKKGKGLGLGVTPVVKSTADVVQSGVQALDTTVNAARGLARIGRDMAKKIGRGAAIGGGAVLGTAVLAAVAAKLAKNRRKNKARKGQA